ncbi:MAG: hypothetical protein VX755_12350 [Pseudomonadota bacterium]|jgi:hypothetical protein|nr:hypothetical protein [Pseudomonadota bacterium]MED5538681.1 hypothetical protein [Pseudomonadota bacterium]
MEENKHTAADRVEAITSLIDNTGGAEREWITGDDLYEIMTTFDERADVSEIAAKINQRIALRTTPAPALSVDLAELKRLHTEAVKYLGGPNLKPDSYGLQVWGECLKGGDSHVFDVRGWGELTGRGHGAFGLSEDEGMAAQRARQAYLVAAWNSVPALIAQIERMGGV